MACVCILLVTKLNMSLTVFNTCVFWHKASTLYWLGVSTNLPSLCMMWVLINQIPLHFICQTFENASIRNLCVLSQMTCQMYHIGHVSQYICSMDVYMDYYSKPAGRILRLWISFKSLLNVFFQGSFTRRGRKDQRNDRQVSWMTLTNDINSYISILYI